MIKTSRIAMSGLVAALLLSAAALLSNPSSAQTAAEPAHEILPLYASGPRAFAMLTLGDGPPTPVVFDTGTDHNLLTESYAQKLKLTIVGSAPVTDAATGKSSTLAVVSLPQPRLSGIAVSPETAQVLPYEEPDMVGIFGPASFSGKLVTIELALNRLRMSPLDSAPLPAVAPTPYRNGLPSLDIVVAGVPMSAHLDSGSTGELTLSRSLMDKIKLKEPAQVVGVAVSALGRQEVYAAQIDGDVVIGPLRLVNPRVMFSGTGAKANIGYGVLRKLTLVIDPAGQRSWVLDPHQGMASLADYAGRYGSRAIRVANGNLIHQRDGRPAYILTPIGSDLFEMAETGDRIQFYRTHGRPVKLELITAEGQVAAADRTN